MKIRRTKLAKMDISFYEEIRKIALKREIEHRDKKASPPTVQRKLIKHNLWPHIRKDLENAEFIEDTKGQFAFDNLFGIFRFVIIAFVIVLFLGGLLYVTGLLNDVFIDVGLENEANSGLPGYTNLTVAASSTFGQFNNSLQALRLVAITLIFAELMSIFIVNAFSKVHPAMFIVWIFIVFLAVWLAAPIANAYESTLQARAYGGLLESFTGANWLVLNLPILTLLVGVLGGIFMFINIVRSGNEEAL